MEIVVFDSFDSDLESLFREFEKKWCWSPFQTFGWLSFWFKCVGGPVHSIKAQIVVLSDQGRTIAILPLGIRRINGVKVLEWLGGIHADYMGALFTRDYQLNARDFIALWTEVLNRITKFDVIHFQRQPMMIGDLENPFVIYFHMQKSEVALQAVINGSWEEFQKSRLSKKLIADSKRQKRRLQDKGELRFSVAEDVGELEEVIKNMIDFKRKRYFDTGLSDMFAIDEHREFFQGLLNVNLEKYKLCCASLKVDHEIIATHVGFISNEQFYYYMPANDNERWKPFSPGRLLMECLMEWSLKEGKYKFDFTVGGEDYKKIWCNNEFALFDYMEPYNIRGEIFYVLTKQLRKLRANKKFNDLLKRIRIFRRSLHFR